MDDAGVERPGPYATDRVTRWIIADFGNFDGYAASCGLDLDDLPYGRALNLYLTMIREWANKERLEEIDEALTPPPSWRDPLTGLPAGWTGSEDDDWAAWEAAAR